MRSFKPFHRTFLRVIITATTCLMLSGCPVAPVVRVSKDVGGGENNRHRNFDINSHFSDMQNDYFDNGGGPMAGNISAVANFSDQYIMFGEKPDGIFGHGRSICIGPQTLVPNLTKVEFHFTDCPAGGLPGWASIVVAAVVPKFPGVLIAAVTAGCWGDTIQTIRQHTIADFNDVFWSYLGTASAEDCIGRSVDGGPVQLGRRTAGGAALIERGMFGTIDIAPL
jgi:hypothetical protein